MCRGSLAESPRTTLRISGSAGIDDDSVGALERGGEPIVVERQRGSAAVLISLIDYKTRFADRDADEQRKVVLQRIREW